MTDTDTVQPLESGAGKKGQIESGMSAGGGGGGAQAVFNDDVSSKQRYAVWSGSQGADDRRRGEGGGP